MFKKINLLSLIFFGITILGTGLNSHATTGGSTTFSNFRYSQEENLIYFITTITDAMGGEKINKYNPLTDTIEVVFDNTQLNEEADDEKYAQIRKLIWSKTKPLPRIDLVKNGFQIDVFVPDFVPEITWQHFIETPLKAKIKQREKIISEIEFTTCDVFWKNKEGQEVRLDYFGVNFDGFLIPNSNSIILLVSTTADCLEVGYVVDKIFLLKNVEILDNTPIEPLETARECRGNWDSAYPPYETNVCPTPGGIYVEVINPKRALSVPEIKNIDKTPLVDETLIVSATKTTRKIILLILIIIALIMIFFFWQKRTKNKVKNN